MQLKENFRTFLSVKADENGALPHRIQIMPLGVWQSPTHGDISLTESDCREFIDHFQDGRFRAGDSLPIDLDHDGGEAAGWITALELVNDGGDTNANGLWATVEWTPLGKEKITNKQYKFFSPEFAPVYRSPQDGSTASNVLIGGGLVNRPFFKDMTPVVCSENTFQLFIENQPNRTTMDLQELLAKNPADLSADEKAFVTEHQSELTDEQRATFGLQTPPQDPPANPPAEPPAPQTPPASEEPPAPTQASEKQVTISAAEKADMDERILAGEKAMKELQSMKFSEKIKGMAFSDSKGKGKFPATDAIHDKLLDLYQSCSEVTVVKLDAFLAALPDVAMFGEVGGAPTANVGTATKRFQEAAQKKVEANPSLSMGEAYNVVASENPDLYKAYEVETANHKPTDQ